MKDEITGRNLKWKALERWENEGGSFCADGAPVMDSGSRSDGRDYHSASFRLDSDRANQSGQQSTSN